MVKNNEVDEIFKVIGEFGLYQLLIFILVGLTSFLPSIFAYSYIFIGATPDYRCKLPNYENDTYDITNEYQRHLVELYIPLKIENKKEVYDGCYLYNRSTIWNETVTSVDVDNSTDKYKCNDWVFSKEYYGKTIVTDWKFVCGDETKKTLFSTLYFIGSYGVLLMGILSDRFGRKHTAYVFIILNAIFSVSITIILNINQINLHVQQSIFAALRFFTGVTSNVYSTAVVLAVEITGSSRRVIAANCIYYFYILGEYLTVLICYTIRDYDTFYILVGAVMSVYTLYFWIIPESPRWLIAKGRYKEAYDVLKRIAKVNKKIMPETVDNKIDSNDTNTNNENTKPVSFSEAIKDIAKSRKLILQTIALLFNWITNNLVYYGISLGTGQLAGDPYLNFTLMTTVELFSVIVSQFTLQKIGRKIPYQINMSITGISLLVIIFIPTKMSALVTAMALIGKFSISFTYGCIYIITPEIYPTSIRTTAVNTCQTFSRIGSIIAPYINLLSELYWYPLPFIIYGGLAVLASILTFFFIPESKGKELPEGFDNIN